MTSARSAVIYVTEIQMQVEGRGSGGTPLTLHRARWRLGFHVEGVVEKAKLDKFRNNNLALTKVRDELKERFDGIDPEVARALLAELESFAQVQPKPKGNHREVVAAGGIEPPTQGFSVLFLTVPNFSHKSISVQ